MAKHNELGKQGEQMAQEYLRKKGYTILATNWKLGDLEVDIIAQQGDTIVFVEVKTRTSDWFQRPEMAVDKRRQRRLCIAANAYLKYHRWQGYGRIDIIAIILNDTRQDINHIENAVSPRGRFY